MSLSSLTWGFQVSWGSFSFQLLEGKGHGAGLQGKIFKGETGGDIIRSSQVLLARTQLYGHTYKMLQNID